MVLNYHFRLKHLSILLILELLVAHSRAAESASPLDLQFINSDWTNIQKPFSPCPGYFTKRPIPVVQAAEISADSSSLAKNGLSKLNGNVEYLDKEQKISADSATAYRDDQSKKVTQITLKDNVEYLAPNFRIVTSEASANLLNNTATLNSDIYYRYYSNNAHGHAKKAIIIKDKNYNIFDAMYTTCAPSAEYNAWQLNASEINIDPQAQVGSAKNTVLYFYNLPIFYTPY